MKKITSFLMLFLMFFGISTVKADNVLLDGSGENPLPGTFDGKQFHWTSRTLTATPETKVIRLTFFDNNTAESTGNAVYPFVAISDLKLNANGSAVTLNTENFASTSTQSGEGSLANLVDSDTSINSYWHSAWNSNKKEFHYLDIKVPDATDITSFTISLISRRTQAAPAVILVTTGTSEENVATQVREYQKNLMPEMTTDLDNPKFYTIRNVRSDRAKKFASARLSNENRLQLGSIDNTSRWFFVDAQEQDLPEGVKSVKIYNAASMQAIQGHTQNPWGAVAKTYYIIPRVKVLDQADQSSYKDGGFVISNSATPASDATGACWNNFQGGDAQVDTWSSRDGGSIWEFAPAQVGTNVINSTGSIEGLLNSYKKVSVTEVEKAGSESAFSYSTSDVDACKTAIDAKTANTYAQYKQARLDINAELEKLYVTGTLADGATFIAQVKGENRFISTNGTTMTTPDQRHLFANVWTAKTQGDTKNVKLYNPYTKKYAGQILTEGGHAKNGLDVATNMVVDPTYAGIYEIVQKGNDYINFRCTNPQNDKTDVAGTKDCLHKSGSNIIVRWEGDAEKSQWVISKVTAEEITAFETEIKDNLTAAVQNVDIMAANQNVGYYHITNQAVVDAAKEKSSNAGNYSCYELDQAVVGLSDALAPNLPVAGKAYYVGNVNKDGNTYYLTNTFNNVNVVVKQNTTEGALKFICKEVNGKYAFVTEDGKFFVWATDSNEGTMNLSGKQNGIYNDVYTEGHDWEVVIGDKVQNNSAKIGTVGLKSKPKNGDAKYLMMQPDGDFHNTATDGVDVSDDANGNSIYWKFVETTYANTPKLTTITGDMVKIKDAISIATFSAPFATELPAGVSAYYISNVQSNVATLAKIEGPVLPKNTGVILTGTSEGNVTMVPATEAGAEITSNLLKNTAGAAQTFDVNSIFILAKNATKGVGFFYGKAGSLAMNKAYVDAASVVTPAGVNALKLVYGDEVTGIEGVEVEENVNAPVYDLSGRRVTNTVKGGIYIQNGKKFIVK